MRRGTAIIIAALVPLLGLGACATAPITAAGPVGSGSGGAPAAPPSAPSQQPTATVAPSSPTAPTPTPAASSAPPTAPSQPGAPAPSPTTPIASPDYTAAPAPEAKPSAPADAHSRTASPTPTKQPDEAPSGDGAPASLHLDPNGPDCSEVKCVALTFDDGPGAHTARLLDMLKQRHAKATFFVVGPNVKANPALVKRAVAEGHQIGNHSWSHPSLTKLSPGAIRKEVRSTSAAVKQATGRGTESIRPPYGAVDKKVRRVLAGEPNAHVILWSVDTLDWKHHDPAKTLAAVKQGVQPGGIILMHDIHKTSVDAVPAVVDYLQSKGYTLVTVDQLLAPEHPRSGKAYSHLG